MTAQVQIPNRPLGMSKGVPKQMVMVSIPIDTTAADQNIFIADQPYRLVSAQRVYRLSSDSGVMTLKKCTGTQAPGAGATIISLSFSSGGNDDNNFNLPLTTQADANNELAAGDRIALDLSGSLNSLRGMCLTLLLMPLGETQYRFLEATNTIEEQGPFGQTGWVKKGVKTIQVGPYNATATDSHLFVADQDYQVIDIKQIHGNLGTDGGAVTAQVMKTIDGQSPDAGVALQAGTFDLKASADRPRTGTLTATEVDLTMRQGDRISVDFTGILTALTGCMFQVVLLPLEDRMYWKNEGAP